MNPMAQKDLLENQRYIFNKFFIYLKAVLFFGWQIFASVLHKSGPNNISKGFFFSLKKELNSSVFRILSKN
jgi:hypothetical protein